VIYTPFGVLTRWDLNHLIILRVQFLLLRNWVDIYPNNAHSLGAADTWLFSSVRFPTSRGLACTMPSTWKLCDQVHGGCASWGLGGTLSFFLGTKKRATQGVGSYQNIPCHTPHTGQPLIQTDTAGSGIIQNHTRHFLPFYLSFPLFYFPVTHFRRGYTLSSCI
jgi:hypothetical protein